MEPERLAIIPQNMHIAIGQCDSAQFAGFEVGPLVLMYLGASRGFGCHADSYASLSIQITVKFHGDPHGFGLICGATHRTQ